MRKISLKHDRSGRTCETCKFCEVKMSEYPCRACMRAGCYGDMWKPAEDLTPDNRPMGIYERIATMWGGYLGHPIDAWEVSQMLKMVIVVMDDMTRAANSVCKTARFCVISVLSVFTWRKFLRRGPKKRRQIFEFLSFEFFFRGPVRGPHGKTHASAIRDILMM